MFVAVAQDVVVVQVLNVVSHVLLSNAREKQIDVNAVERHFDNWHERFFHH